MSVIPIGEFKAKCLRILDEVSKTHEPVTVIKHGKPIARLMPIPAQPRSRYGLAKGTLFYAEDDYLLSTGEVWGNAVK